MSTFLTGKQLNDFVYDIIWKAESELTIISPFIKLDDYFKQIFEKHKYNHQLQITIVFGKNEYAPNKSLQTADFEFFKQFKNIAILYNKDLHAKYYLNEKRAVITSINLYDKSFENNIEYGVGFESSILGKIQDDMYATASNSNRQTIGKSQLVYLKRPVYEKALLSSITGAKNYMDSEVMYDKTAIIGSRFKWEKEIKKSITDYPSELQHVTNAERPAKPEIAKEKESPTQGYCIRTGVKIPFDIKRPMCYSAYSSWAMFGDVNYREKYCHKTGKRSNGKTSMKNPILE